MRLTRRHAREFEPVELAALADGSIAPERRVPLEARLAASPELGERLAEQERAVALARSAAAAIEAPAGLRERIETRRHRGRIPGSRRRPVFVGAVAVAAVAAALATGLIALRPGSSGEQFRAALSATVLAPGARGKATLTKTSSGWRIGLEATGLPRLAGRRFYEAWLRNPAGVLVPIGTFNDARKVTLWAGVSPSDFTMLTVTRERADGNQASSGEKVLVGTITGAR